MDIIIDILGILLCVLVMASAQLYGASILIHHTGHGQGIRPRWLGRLVAELAGILLLRQSLNLYKTTHGFHHSKQTFARAGLDPDAGLIQKLGFQRGDSVEVSKQKLWRALFSPRLHAKFLLKRLRMTFAKTDEPLRSLAAWFIWLLLFLLVWQQQLVLSFVLLVLVSTIAGNISALLELLSRHKWLLEIESPDPQARQWALSHARFYGIVPPEKGASGWRWLAWCGLTLIAIAERFIVGAGDLQWHIGHHVGWDREDYQGQPAWTNPAYAYAKHLGELDDDKVYLSTNAAIQAWFQELAKAPKDYDK